MMDALVDLSLSNSLADLAARINAEHDLAAEAFSRGLVHALAAGELLIEAKARLQHGQWMPWLKEHCRIPDRTARLYMRLAGHREKIEGKMATVANLSINDAIGLVQEPVSDLDALDEIVTVIDEAEAELRAMQRGRKTADLYLAALRVIVTTQHRLDGVMNSAAFRDRQFDPMKAKQRNDAIDRILVFFRRGGEWANHAIAFANGEPRKPFHTDKGYERLRRWFAGEPRPKAGDELPKLAAE